MRYSHNLQLKSYNFYRWMIIIIVVSVFSSCKEDPFDDCLISTGTIVTETRPVTDFTAIDIYNNPQVIITQDTLNSITIQAGKHLMGNITTTIANGKLTIQNNNECNWLRSYDKPLNIYIHVKNLTHVNHYGSGKVYSTNTITNDTVDVNVINSGDLTFIINAQNSYSRTHAWAGDVTFSGTTVNHYVYDVGQGIAHCDNLSAQNVIVISKGTGNCYVNAQSNLHTEISGEGNVYYSGSPPVITTINPGPGQLIHIQ